MTGTDTDAEQIQGKDRASDPSPAGSDRGAPGSAGADPLNEASEATPEPPAGCCGLDESSPAWAAALVYTLRIVGKPMIPNGAFQVVCPLGHGRRCDG